VLDAGSGIRRQAQHVPDAALGVDEGGRLGVDLAAEVGDVRLDDRAVPAEVVVPDVVEDLDFDSTRLGLSSR
jgi:hypothetical protein